MAGFTLFIVMHTAYEVKFPKYPIYIYSLIKMRIPTYKEAAAVGGNSFVVADTHTSQTHR